MEKLAAEEEVRILGVRGQPGSDGGTVSPLATRQVQTRNLPFAVSASLILSYLIDS